MQALHISIFNLIQSFSIQHSRYVREPLAHTDYETKHHYDNYYEAEKTF